MKTVNKFSVYKRPPTKTKKGVTNLTPFKGKKGVYTIFEDGKRVYVGNSRHDLYRTILRHFQRWVDMEQPGRISYESRIKSGTSYKVEVTVLDDPEKILILESMLIQQHEPRDNKDSQYTIYNNKYKDRTENKQIVNEYNNAQEYNVEDLEEAPF